MFGTKMCRHTKHVPPTDSIDYRQIDHCRVGVISGPSAAYLPHK